MVLSLANSEATLLVCLIGIGIMWGSIIVLPYVIALNVMPKNKNGTYLGIFNISITLPQILCALTLPWAYKYIFGYHANHLLTLAGVLILISSMCWFRLETSSMEQPVIDTATIENYE